MFGSDLFWELSESEMMPLAMRGGAVSPVTSYLAIEPGVRPSTEGLDEQEGGRGEGIGLGSIGSIGHGGGTGDIGFDHGAYLKRRLAAAWKRCGSQGISATVSLETTLAEVVDVLDVKPGVGTAAGPVACLTEEIWKLHLPDSFRRVPRSTWSIHLDRID